jgi:Arc/MetJ-type ribon-helix-helix transcriptional regulator
MNTVSRHLAAEDRYDAMPYRRCGRSGLAPGEGPTFPFWYRFGMSKQIAVRLDDDLVAFVDEIVQSGRERSRAAVVTRALERERRRIVAARDAEILARTGPDSELAGLAEHAVGRPLDG